MPEGDTVFRAARTMNRVLAGRVLTATDFRVPKLANADLSGQRVTEVVSVGKHLLIRTDAGTSVRTHFKMEGEWRLYHPGDRWHGPEHEIRAVLMTEPWVAVGYRLAMVEVIPTAQEEKLIGHLGPDILAEEWNLKEAMLRIEAEPEVEVSVALLDQRKVAGIGNIYKNESLFLAGVHPWTPVSKVKNLERILRIAHGLMKLNTHHPDQATTGRTRKGQQWWVMERPGHPCRRCTTLVEVGRQGFPERLTYWCPLCQRKLT